MKIIRTLVICFVAVFSSDLFSAPSSSLQVPNAKTHESFLLEAWKPGKPTLVVFKDPSCPYCVRDLKKRSQLENYNVFLFWAPILGDRSVDHVNAFFKCSSTSSTQVLNAVIRRSIPDCEGQFNKESFALNNAIVENYDPRAVPQYWLGGRQVSLSRLNLSRNVIDSQSIVMASPVKIDWSRYMPSAMNQTLPARNSIGLVLPKGYSLTKQELTALVNDDHYNWYLFTHNIDANHDVAALCALQQRECSPVLKKQLRKNSAEFMLLTGLNNIEKPKFIFEGKALIKREINYLIPWHISSLLARQ
jgi:glutaredoxin